MKELVVKIGNGEVLLVDGDVALARVETGSLSDEDVCYYLIGAIGSSFPVIERMASSQE